MGDEFKEEMPGVGSGRDGAWLCWLLNAIVRILVSTLR